MGLAPRSLSASSTKPLDFIRAVGNAYRKSHRTLPLMDALAVHPYPNPNASPPPPNRAAYEDPSFYGITQLDRVKQAVHDPFRKTPQPTAPTSGGWQSGLEYPDGTPKPSLAAVHQAITAGCTGPLVSWAPGKNPPAPKPKLKPKSHSKHH
jgi:hypothetical protein